MKSICILVQNYYEVDIRVRRKAEALVAAGYSVDVFALASSYSKSKTYVLNGVNVFTLSLGKQRGSLLRYVYEYFSFFLWSFFKLSMRMGSRRYSVVDVNNLPDFLVFAGIYARLRGAKIVFDMHEITPEFYLSKYGIKPESILIQCHKLVEWASCCFADHVITINEPIAQLLENRGLRRSKTSIIMNAVDESLFASVVDTPRTDTARDPEKFIMMYHGTLTHIYGLDIAIEAFGKAQSEMPGAELWILGNGPKKNSLESLAQKLGLNAKVRFIGNVLPQEVPQWLKRCDIGVLATRKDVFLDLSFSNKLSEYIIMGKAVISSRLKAIRYYFSDEAFAFFEPNHPDDLAKQMVRLYRNSALCSRLAEKARQEYAPICWEIMKGRYLALIADQLGTEVGIPKPSSAPVTSASVS